MKKDFKQSKKLLALAMAILLFIFCRANIYGLSFFGYSYAFALVFNRFYSLAIALCYFLFGLINRFTFEGLINSALVSALLIILAITIKANKKGNAIMLLLFCGFSRLANIYFNFYSLKGLLFAFIDLVAGLAFCYICLKVISALLKRGIQSFSRGEFAFACITLIGLFCGLTNIYIVINVSKLIFILLILLSSISLKHRTLYVATFISIACIFTGAELPSLIVYYLIAFATLLISAHNKFLSASVSCLIDALVGSMLNFALIDFLPTLFAAFIFLAIPKKIIHNISSYVFPNTSNLITAYYASKKEAQVKEKLIKMSDVFKQMQSYYRTLLIEESDGSNAARLYAYEVKDSMCSNCINRLACEEKNLTPCFEDLVRRAIDKGKVNLLDAPRLLSSNCTKLNLCLAHINQKVDGYIAQTKKHSEENENKLNMCVQLAGTSKIFAELSKQFSNGEKANLIKGRQIKDCLLKQQIICKECMVIETADGISEILMIVRNIDVVNPALTDVCRSLYNMQFEKKNCFQTQNMGWSILSLVPGNRYELACGYASIAKEVGALNGDNYVYSKITDSKFLVAICDGMGHGNKANDISSTAINLIESYYKSGLSSQIAIEGVNSMLLNSGGAFSTLDATVVDTITGEIEFIKVGSTISVIKQAKQSQIVNVESLPLGVEEMTPTVHKYTLFEGDIVVLASDGVIDVFSSHEEFLNYINNEFIINMQVFAENILEEAMGRQPNRKDDMTVVAFKLAAKR